MQESHCQRHPKNDPCTKTWPTFTRSNPRKARRQLCRKHPTTQELTALQTHSLPFSSSNFQPLFSINKHAPALASPTPHSQPFRAPDRSLELPPRVLEALIIEAARLEPHSRYACLFRLFQDFERCRWRCDDGEGGLRRRWEGKWRRDRGVLLREDADTRAARIDRRCRKGMEKVPGVDWATVSVIDR